MHVEAGDYAEFVTKKFMIAMHDIVNNNLIQTHFLLAMGW